LYTVHNLRNLIHLIQLPDAKESEIFYDKFRFKLLLRDQDILVPNTYDYITEIDDFTHLKYLEEFVIKPNQSSSGINVYLLKKIAPDTYKEIDGRIHDWTFVDGKIKNILGISVCGGVIIEETIHNPPEFDIFNSTKGVIDLRLYMLDDKILMGKFRIPTKKSLGYANTSRKATAMYVNSKGIITEEGMFNNTTTTHPNSDKDFEGRSLPYWEKFAETGVKVARAFDLRFHSVDLTINKKGEACCIESEAIPYLSFFTPKACEYLMKLMD